MVNLLDIRYVRLGTRDLVRRHAFRARGGRPRAGARGRWRALLPQRCRATIRWSTPTATPPDHATGFELRDAAEMDSAAAFLETRGMRVTRSTADECEQRRVQSFIPFH